MFQLANFIFSFILGLVLFAVLSERSAGALISLYSLFLLIPNLALSVRRMHDVNNSGFWLFINLVPLVGGIWFFILTISSGTDGYNKYGEDPRYEGF